LISFGTLVILLLLKPLVVTLQFNLTREFYTMTKTDACDS